jgi:hypothetical protein
MKVLIKQTQYGWQYKCEGDTMFKYFADNVQTREQMLNYFRQGKHTSSGRSFNEPELLFANQQGAPAKLYQIKKGEKMVTGELVARVDLDKMFLFDDVCTDADKLEFLRHYLPEDNEAESFESDKDKINSYLQIADAELKTAYKKFINDKLTPEAMRKQCEQNAAGYGLSAEIIFD